MGSSLDEASYIDVEEVCVCVLLIDYVETMVVITRCLRQQWELY